MDRRQAIWPWAAAGLVASLCILAWGLLRSPQNAFDDAFITYRYAAHLQDGLGLVYNPGEWVLGTTAPLYAILLGALSRLGPTVEWWGHWVSVAAWVVSAWTALALFRQHERPAAGAVAALFLAVLPLGVPTLGMETATLLALLLLSAWAWTGDRPVLAPLFSVLAVLTRLDAGLLVALLFAARSLSRRRILWRQALLSAALALPWFAYATWRYDSPLPNSVLAKVNQNQLMEVSGSVSFIAQFARHLTDGSPLLAVAIVVALAVGLYVIVRYACAWWWLPAWVILYIGTYTALNVASTFPWYFVPPLAGFALTAALGLGHLLGDSVAAPVRPRATLLRAVGGLACAGVILFFHGRGALADSLSDRPGYLPEYREAGAWLAANTDPMARVAAIEIGVIGYLSGRPILDTMGLVSPELRGHLVGWEETLTYALWQVEPAYLVTLTGTGWDTLTPQWWFREQYRGAATFGRVTIYERQPAAPPAGYVVTERAEFAEGFAVTGFETAGQMLAPGEPLTLLLHVEVARTPPGDCELVLHLEDTATFQDISELKERPYGGGYGCAAWQPGDRLRIPLRIAVPPDAAAGTYRLRLELYDPDQAAYFTLAAQPDVQAVRLGWLRVGNPPQATTLAAAGTPLVCWQDGLALVSVALPDGPLRGGDLLPLDLRWRADGTPERDLTFFVHLLDTAGEIVAQTDRRPFDGRFPTPAWLPGETLQDTYALPLPPELPAGDYRLRVGFYDDAGRLPLADSTADFAVLDEVVRVEGN